MLGKIDETSAPRKADTSSRRKLFALGVLLLAPVVSGLALVAGLPPANWEWLGWLSIAPLLLAVNGLRPLERVGLGLLAGFVAATAAAGGRVTDPTFAYPLFLFGWFGLFLGIVTGIAAGLRRRFIGIPWV